MELLIMNDFIKEFIIDGELIINKIQFNELNSKYSVDYQIMNNKINKPSIFDMF